MPIADIDYREYFTPDSLEKLESAFNHYDLDGSGQITEAELYAVLRNLGRPVNKGQLREIFKMVDYNDSGDIDFEEFCVLEIMLQQMRPHPALIKYADYLTEGQVKALERYFGLQDTGASGVIDMAGFIRVLEAMGSRATREEGEEIFKQADLSGNGTLDFATVCSTWAVLSGMRKRCNYREFLSGEQVLQLRQAFNVSDPTGKGAVGRRDLEDLLKRVGITARKSQLEWLFKTFDADGSGDIDFEEFAVMVLRLKGLRRMRIIRPDTCSCVELWRNEDFSVKELQQAGFQLHHLRAAGIPAGKLHTEGGIPALELRRAGYSPAELRHGGFGAAELRRCGFSLTDLRIAGFSDKILEHADRQLKACLSAGDLSSLPQHRPLSRGAPVRGAVLTNAGAAQLQPMINCPWQLPPRPMTQMIREHTDWRPRMRGQRHLIALGA